MMGSNTRQKEPIVCKRDTDVDMHDTDMPGRAITTCPAPIRLKDFHAFLHCKQNGISTFLTFC